MPYELDQINAHAAAAAGQIRLDEYLDLCAERGWTADSRVIACEARRIACEVRRIACEARRMAREDERLIAESVKGKEK